MDTSKLLLYSLVVSPHPKLITLDHHPCENRGKFPWKIRGMIHEDDPLSSSASSCPPAARKAAPILAKCEGLVLDSGPMWTALVTDFATYIYLVYLI